MPPLKQLLIVNKTARSYYSWETRFIEHLLNRFSSSLRTDVVITSSLSELEQAVQEHKNIPDILGFGGGDDTASRVLTAVAESWGRIPDYLANYAMGNVNSLADFLNLSDGTIDKLKKKMQIKSTKAIQLASRISDTLCYNQKIPTEEVGLLDINGRKGFNVGFGATPKLIWTYFGKSIREYRLLEEKLADSAPEEYPQVLDKLFGDPRDVNPFYAAATGLRTIASSLIPSPHNYFYQEPIKGEIYIDGKKVETAGLDGIYISTYGKLNFGIKGITLTISPGARDEPGKIEVVLCSQSVLGVVKQIPKLARAERLKNVEYLQCREFELRTEQPQLGVVEDSFIAGKVFKIRYDQPLNFISL